MVGVLQQLDDDVLDVLADVAGLGQRGGVGDRERHVEDACASVCASSVLPRAGGAEQQDVALAELDVVATTLRVDALVVVVDRDRQDLLRAGSWPTT